MYQKKDQGAEKCRLDRGDVRPRLSRIELRGTKGQKTRQAKGRDERDEILGSIVAAATWILAIVADLIAVLGQLL